MATGLAVAAVNKGITTYISRVGLRTGNTALQERLSYAQSTAQRAIGIGAALIGGALTGNPLAVVGAAVSAVSWGVDIGIQAENLRLEREVEGIGIRQANIRAGAGGGRTSKE